MERIRSADVATVLRRRIQWGMHLGLIKSGDRLPSLRAGAAEFGVDQRSILSAYRELSREGLVDMRPRSGIYVAAAARHSLGRPTKSQWILDMFIEGFNRGVPPVALGEKLSGVLTARTLSAVCIECNTDSALAITLQLHDDFGIAATWVDMASLHDEDARERIQNADLVLTTHFHVADVRGVAQEFDRPLVLVSSDRDHSAQIRATLSRGPVYVIGVDPRMADKLCAAWTGARWLANFRPIIVGRDDLAAIPAGSPVFVTRAAAEALPVEVFPHGAIMMAHTFSAETRIAILDILVTPSQTGSDVGSFSADPTFGSAEPKALSAYRATR
ncbi:MAG: GntR family transcriptional regulator [Gemmatimonadaceae bacterium]